MNDLDETRIENLKVAHSNLTAAAQSETALAKFSPHGLADLDKASLMDRVDSKFVVPAALVPSLLDELSVWYSILEIGGKRTSDYHNVYFDTEDYTHYQAHHSRRAGRYKVRRRTYLDSDLSFLEVKYRSNLSRTVKTRIPVPTEGCGISSAENEFMQASGVLRFGPLSPKQKGCYTRIALANEAEAERVTIDSGLSIVDIDTSKKHTMGPWVVVEVKQQRLNRRSPYFAWAKKNAVRQCSFSKYCMGLYFTGPERLKRNNFHQVAHQIRQTKNRNALQVYTQAHTQAPQSEAYSEQFVSTVGIG